MANVIRLTLILYLNSLTKKTFQLQSTQPGKKFCLRETFDSLTWPETVAESTAIIPCMGEFSGTASRMCLSNGTWETPNVECFKKLIQDAKSSLGQIEIGIIEGAFGASVESLANATKDSMNAADISKTIEALDIAFSIINKSTEVTKKDVRNLVDVISNLLTEDTKPAWEKLEKKNKMTAARVIKQMNDLGKVASQKLNETTMISTKNIVLEVARVNVFGNITFPSRDTNQPEWVRESDSNVFVPSGALKDNFGANETVIMNAVLFRNIKDLLPKYENTRRVVNSFVLSISLQKTLENLKDKISLNFSHLSSGYSECTFWDFNINPDHGGYWSKRGCEVVRSNSNYTVCSCDDLTNFAILTKPMSNNDREIIHMITLIGCSISIIALGLTIIVYVIFWKNVTAEDVSKSQSVLLMNMCVSLIIAFLISVSVIEGPREKRLCTAIAAVLQYFFLVVLFSMFAEGIDMAIALTVVFASRFHRLPWLLLLSWVGPAVIITISLVSTNTKGFVNGEACWSTMDDYAIWYFIVPVLLIFLANIICVAFILKALLSSHCMLRQTVKERLRTGARAIGILTPLLGFSWLFSALSLNEYIFTVIGSLQGVFIFITYCVFNKNIRKDTPKKEKPEKRVPTKQ